MYIISIHVWINGLNHICPNASTSYQTPIVYIRNSFCMCMRMWLWFSRFRRLHFTWDMLVLYIHSWLHCCQTSVARRLKQNKTKRLKQQNHEIYHFLVLPMPQGFFVGRTMLLDIHTASSLHGRTQCHIKIVKLFQPLSTCEFPLCSALTLPWQHILFHWVAPWSFFVATVGWVGWLKRFTPSRCLHLIFFWAW